MDVLGVINYEDDQAASVAHQHKYTRLPSV